MKDPSFPSQSEEHSIKNHGFFSEKGTSEGILGSFVFEWKLRPSSSTLLNFPDEITWITSKDKGNLEIYPFLKTR